MKGKALITMARFSLGASQGVLFAGLGLNKYREVLPHWLITQLGHMLGRAAHHHPVIFITWVVE